MKKLLVNLTLIFLTVVFLLGMQKQNANLPNSQDLYGQGYQLYQEGKIEEALKYFDKALAVNPTHLLAWCYKGSALAELKKWDDALLAFDSALKIDDECIYALSGKSDVLKEIGRKSDSDALLEKIVNIQPKENDALGYICRGLAYYDKGNLDLAIANYNSALKIRTDDANAYYHRGLAYYWQGKYDLSIADYTSALRIDPQFAFAYYGRANAYYVQNKFYLAIADYTSGLGINPRYEAYLYRGHSYYGQGKYDLAIADYTSALKFNSKDLTAYMKRGSAYSKIGNMSSARRDFEKAIELDPSGSDGEKARQELERLAGSASVQVDDTDILSKASSYQQIAKVKEESGDLQGALEAYSNIIQIQQAWAQSGSENEQHQLKWYATGAYNGRALIFQKMGKYQTAMDEFKTAMRLSPSDAYLFSNRANLREKTGDVLGALIDYGVAMRIEPEDTSTRINKALLLERLGWYQDAIWQYDRILEGKAQNSAKVWAYRGDAKRQYGFSLGANEKEAKTQLQTAIDDFNKAIEIKPDYAWAYRARGETRLLLDEFDKGARDFEKALSLDPNLKDVREELGLANIALKRWNKATEQLQEALNLAGVSSDVGMDDQTVQKLADSLLGTKTPYEDIASQIVEFNVLRQAVVDPKSGGVVLMGEYDPRFGDDPIPYFDILKTAVAYPNATFSLGAPLEVERELSSKLNLSEEQFNSRLMSYFHKNGMYGALLLEIFMSLPDGRIGTLVPTNPGQARAFEVEADDSGKLVSMAQFFGYPITSLMKILIYGPTIEESLKGIESFDLPRELYYYFMPLSETKTENADAYFAFLEEIFRNVQRQDLVNKVQILKDAFHRGENRERLGALAGELESIANDPSISVAGLMGIYEKIFMFIDRRDWVERVKNIRQALQRGDIGQANYLGQELSRKLKEEEFRPEGILNLMPLYMPKGVMAHGTRIDPSIIRDALGLDPIIIPEFHELPPNSQLARIAFEADYTLKLLSSMAWVKEAIPDHVLSDEWEQQHDPLFSQNGRAAKNTLNWLEPERIEISETVSPSELTYCFGGASVRIKPETRYINDRSGKKFADAADESYAQYLTSHFDQYAQIFPSLHELREAYKILALARLLRSRSIIPLPDQSVKLTWTPPKEVTGFMTFYLKPSSQRKYTGIGIWTVEGGVNLRVSESAIKPMTVPSPTKKPVNFVFSETGPLAGKYTIAIGDKTVSISTAGFLSPEHVAHVISAAGGNVDPEDIKCSKAYIETQTKRLEEHIAISQQMLKDIQAKSSAWEQSFDEYMKLAKQRAYEWRLAAAFNLVGVAANGARIIKTAQNLGKSIPRVLAKGRWGLAQRSVRAFVQKINPSLKGLSIQAKNLELKLALHQKIIWKAAEHVDTANNWFNDVYKNGGSPVQMAARMEGFLWKKLAADMMTDVNMPEIAAASATIVLPFIGLAKGLYDYGQAAYKFYEVAQDIKQSVDSVDNLETTRQRIFESMKKAGKQLEEFRQNRCK